MNRLSKALGWVGRQLRRLLPTLLIGREKAVVAFLTPLVVGWVAQLAGVHVSVSIVEQLLMAATIGITVHSTTNTPAGAP